MSEVLKANEEVYIGNLLSIKVERYLLFFTSAIALVVLVLFAFQPANILVRYVSDDAYYYLQVAKHIAAGQGPTFDGITWTTGFHPLYAIVLATIDKLFEPSRDTFVALGMLFNVLCFFVTGGLLYSSARLLWSASAGRWAGIIWFSNAHTMLLVATGLEGALYAACLALLLNLVVRTIISRKISMLYAIYSGIYLGFASALCVLSRTDALLIMALFGLYLLFFSSSTISKRFVRAACFGIVTLLPMFAWFWYCQKSTGSTLQGSAEMKTLWRCMETDGYGLWKNVLFGIDIFQTWISKSIFKIPLLKYVLLFSIILLFKKGVLQSRRITRPLLHILWISLILLGLAYSIFLPKVWTWYYAPSLVFLTMFTAGGIYSLLFVNEKNRLQNYVSRILPIILLLSAVESYGHLAIKSIRGRNRYQTETLAVAEWMANNLSPNARVGAWNSGIYSWYSGLQTVNLDGLINNDIPQLFKNNELVSDYIVKMGIEYVVDNAEYMEWHCPKLTTNDYSVIYYHEGRDGHSKTVWKINKHIDSGPILVH